MDSLLRSGFPAFAGMAWRSASFLSFRQRSPRRGIWGGLPGIPNPLVHYVGLADSFKSPSSNCLHITAQATRRASRPAGESREGAALFGGGLGVPPQPLSDPLPAREAGGPPEWGRAHSPVTHGEALEPFSRATGVSSSVPSDDARGFPEVGLAHPEILKSPSEGRLKNLRPLPSQLSQRRQRS